LNWLLVVGGERFIRNYLPALIVNVPGKHETRPTTVLVHPQVEWLTACNNVYLTRLSGRTTLITPVAPLIAINVDDATIIRSQPKLNRLMHRDRDEPSHVNHEQIACAVLVWLTVIRTIDVVLNLRTTQHILSS
jgi:hypothetical protein